MSLRRDSLALKKHVPVQGSLLALLPRDATVVKDPKTSSCLLAETHCALKANGIA